MLTFLNSDGFNFNNNPNSSQKVVIRYDFYQTTQDFLELSEKWWSGRRGKPFQAFLD